jgi:hypothetical protein
MQSMQSMDIEPRMKHIGRVFGNFAGPCRHCTLRHKFHRQPYFLDVPAARISACMAALRYPQRQGKESSDA